MLTVIPSKDMNALIRTRFLMGLTLIALSASAQALTATWNSSADVPATAGSYSASGTVNFTLNFAPSTGTNLTVVKNTGLGFISGTFSNLAQGQAVPLTFNGVTYSFVANYFGGTGNDLTLQWANVRPLAWGSNVWGQLGDGSLTDRLVPTAVTTSGVLSGKTVIDLSTGVFHSLALCSDGTVAAWGFNGDGQLGNNTTTNSPLPVLVNANGALAGKTVISVVAGNSHSLALCSDGTVVAWGSNSAGQLGDGSTTNRLSPVVINTAGGLAGKTVIAVGAGSVHSLALCSDGKMATWGGNSDGQLGNSSTMPNSVPVLVNTAGILAGKSVVAIAPGYNHNVALCSDGTLAAWGDGISGQLGNNSTLDSSQPVSVNISGVLSGRTITAVASGRDHTLVLCTDGTLAAWGSNFGGQLGDGTTTSASLPVLVTTAGVLSGKTVITISAASQSNQVLCADGSLVAWGRMGFLGSLGNGNNTTVQSSLPVIVSTTNFAGNERFLMPFGSPSADQVFAIVAAPVLSAPIVTTSAATSITGTTATVNGTVNANGSNTNVSFDYGTSTSYGTNVGGLPPLVSGSSNTAVNASLPGLIPGTTYHFRVKGSSAGGTTNGSDRTFTTAITNNSNLSNLIPSAGTLTPVFSSNTLSYTASVSNATSSITLIPTLADSLASVRVNGILVPSGFASGAISLNVGSNSITTIVTAQDGITTKTYSVNVTRAAATATTKLTTNVFNDTVPKWHPSNGKIAYHRINGVGAMELASVNSNGTGETLMASGLEQPPYGYTTLISWLGSTNTLLCVETNTFHELLAFNTTLAPFARTVADGNDAAFTRKLFVPGGRYSNCFVASRDGNTVAWRDQPNAGGTNTLSIRCAPYLLLSDQDTNAVGTVVITATDPSIGTRGMALSPDGTKLVISIPNGTGFDLWRYNTDGTGSPLQLTTNGITGNVNLNADVSPDGTKVLYQHGTAAPGSSDLWLMNIDGTGKTNITQTSGVDESAPSWGPDGSQYAFARIDGSESNIYRDTLPAASSTMTINFDNMAEGLKSSNFLAAYGVTSVTTSGSVGAGAPLVSAQTGSNTTIPSAPNLLIQSSNSNDQNQAQTMRFDFNPLLSAFSLTRAGKFGGGSTDTWHADFYNSVGTLIGTFGESTPLVNAAPQIFSFSAPSGQTIARMDLVSVWTGIATNRNIPVDDFVLTSSQSQVSSNADLSALSLSAGTLSPTFVSGTTSYTASVSNATTSLTVTPTVADGTATVTVNGTGLASGTPSGSINLNVGNNTITTVVTPQSGATKTYTVVVTRAASTNANLSNLALSVGSLSPTFASATTSYTASVSNTTTSLTVTPTVADANATVTVNSVGVTSGSASGSINLNVGNNTITTVVTPQSGGAQTYTVVVARAPSTNANLSNLVLSGVSLSPDFDSGTLSYTASVPNATTSLTVTPTVVDSTATVKVNNVTVNSGSASGNINLAVGNNTITTVAKAQDGVTTKSYTVVVTRAPSSNANLANLAQNTGTLSPAFASGTTSYTSMVAYPISTIRITPTVADSTATVKVNNVTVSSGSQSGVINLSVGINTITTVVKAQDGTTTGTYTIGITRIAPSTNANLVNLESSIGSLSPAFATATTSYTANVSHLTKSITVTPTVADSTATVKINNVTVTSASASGAINLSVGSNTITTVVTAQDGTTTKTYSIEVTRAPLIAIWNAATDIPLTTSNYTAEGAVSFTLNFAPLAGTTLTVINHTNLGFISGRFTNLAQGQAVDLTYNGITYEFVANYYGGTGNDLVLLWASVRAVAWGSNGSGKLGIGNTVNSQTLADVNQAGVLADKTVIAISAGADHSLAVCSDGTLVAWGDNKFGQLGNNSLTASTVPVAVSTAGALSGKMVIAVVAGTNFSLALCSDGTVVSWGDNAFGQLGDNSTVLRKVPVAVYTAGVLSGKTVIAISNGQFHSLALCSDGTLFSWGGNFSGQIGDNSTTQRKVPVAVFTGTGSALSGKTVIAIASAQYHNLALCSNGTIAAWGGNFSGQLGDNTISQRLTPITVNTSGVLSGKIVSAIAAGGFGHSLALCTDGTLAAWGVNSFGQLGDNSTTQRSLPVAVNTAGVLSGKAVVAIAAGANHSLALCADNTVTSWGENTNSQLGNGSVLSSPVPVLLDTAELAIGERFTQVTSGGCAFHNFGIVASPAPTGPVPVVTSLAATSVTSTSAILNGTVNANGASTAVSFNYGNTVTYGTTIGGTPTPVTGSIATAVSATLTGLSPGNTYHFRVRGTNGNGTRKGGDLTFSTPSNNANLGNLSVSAGSLNPAFSNGTTSYTAIVSNVTTSITVTPTVAESHATVTVNGVSVTSGSASGGVSLIVGDNTIDTLVTAQDGVTTRTYSVVVTRLPISNNANLSAITLSKGTLSPAFSAGTTGYTASVSSSVSSITITPTVADSGATVKVNNASVASGSPSGTINLIMGDNTINTDVTAENGVSTRTYSVVITRGVPSTNANLSGLTLSAGFLNPTFTSGTTAYTANVLFASSSITLTPTVADGAATVKVNNVTVASGSPSGGISLNVGDNTITTVVTAENGTTTRSYSVVVTRAPMEFLWGGNNGNWSDFSKWVELEAPVVGGNPPVGSATIPTILHFTNNPIPINGTTPTTYTAINDRPIASGQNSGYFGISKLILDGGATGASGTGTNIIGSPTPGFGDPNLFFPNGGNIVNSTSDGIGYTIQNYITAHLNLTLSGDGTAAVKIGSALQSNMFIQPWTFPASLNVVKIGTSTFELPSAQFNSTSYEIREGALQTAPSIMNSGAITLGHSSSMGATLLLGTNGTSAGGLADTADVTVVAGPVGSTRTIYSMSTSASEIVSLAGDLTIQSGASVRMFTGTDLYSTISLGGSGSTLSGSGNLIVAGSGRLAINPSTNNSGFTGNIIIESGLLVVPPAGGGGGGFAPPSTTLGGGVMSFDMSNGSYPQDVTVIPPVEGAPPSVFNVTNNGTLAGALTMNGGADMTVAAGKNFVFDGGLSGTIPVNQSLNVNATGTGSVALSGNNSGFSGAIDFGRDVGSAGASASLVIGDAAAFPATVEVNVFAGKLIFAAPGNTIAAGSIDFMAAAPGAAAPELVLQNDTPGTPKTVTLQGPISYARDTIIQINEAADLLGITGNLTNTTPDAGIDKTGPGTLILSPLGNGLPVDNYTAPTNVTEGTLKVNRDISDSNVSVANGATLGGSGMVGDLTVAVGAIIAPGNSPGTLTTGAATLAGSTLAVEIDGSLADKLVSTGVMNIDGAALTVTDLGGGFTPGAAYVIAQGTSLTGTFSSVPSNYVVTYTPTQAILTQTLTAWINGFNPSLSIADKLPSADPDKDGISNLLELTLGGNPVHSSQTILPTQSIEGNNLVIAFKRSDSSELGSTLSLEISDNLGQWNIIPPILIGQTTSGPMTIGENGAAPDDVTVIIPLGPNSAKFVRLRVVSATP
jgi:alpha-tubulin suppressor-like RCC1 family protein